MARDLTAGSRRIRNLQTAALLVAVAGMVLAGMLIASPTTETTGRLAPLMLVAFLLEALIVGAVMASLKARGLVRRINLLGGAFNRGAEGDLTVRVDLGADDELSQLGNNFNGMLEKLSGMVSGIDASIVELRQIGSRSDAASRKVLEAAKVQAEEVAETAGAIAAINRSSDRVARGVGQLASSSAENIESIREMGESIAEVRKDVEAQAKVIQEVSSSILQAGAVVEETDRSLAALTHSANATSSSLAEMDLSIRQVEKSVRETTQVAATVREEAHKGKEAVEATIAGIDDIRTSSGATYASISRLSERVAAIGKIVSVIEELTEQTNLLALNSAILAAQAGEHGKGFAIVSSEIKGLADRTRRSTMEIVGLIQGIREETGKAVTAIRTTEERVADGEQLSHRSGDALNRIVASVQVVTDQVDEIARATEEQSRGSRNIQLSIHDVTDSVARIASSSREQTAASKSIMKAVELMKELTARVLASSARQEQVGRGIANATEQMAGVVETIRAAGVEQATSCALITGSGGRVQESADMTLDAARTMGAAMESLAAQIEVLRKEIAKLQVS
jgi:methyl-accepting chemotaxis protein